jgi:hypothetical protein
MNKQSHNSPSSLILQCSGNTKRNTSKHRPKVGGPQNKFRKFADLKNSLICEPPQMWQFAYSRFAGPMFYAVCRFAVCEFAFGVSNSFSELETFTNLQIPNIIYLVNAVVQIYAKFKITAELLRGFVMKG